MLKGTTEHRLFKGVQGVGTGRGKNGRINGELFGAANILRYDGDALLTADCVDRELKKEEEASARWSERTTCEAHFWATWSLFDSPV